MLTTTTTANAANRRWVAYTCTRRAYLESTDANNARPGRILAVTLSDVARTYRGV